MLSKSKVCFQFAQTTEEILNVYEIFKNPSQNPLSLWIEPSPCAVSEGRKGRVGRIKVSIRNYVKEPRRGAMRV